MAGSLPGPIRVLCIDEMPHSQRAFCKHSKHAQAGALVVPALANGRAYPLGRPVTVWGGWAQ